MTLAEWASLPMGRHELPLAGGHIWTPPPGLVEYTASLYPCDADAELRKLRHWLIADGRRRRPAERMAMLLARWFRNAANDRLADQSGPRAATVWQTRMLDAEKMVKAALAAKAV